jgi:hypothetical protein
VQLARTQVAGHPLHVGQPHLADQDAVTGILPGEAAPGAVDVVDPVAVDERMIASRRRAGLIVGQGRVLDQQGGGVYPEPVHPAVEPEAEDVLELGPHLGVVPVEVGLLRGE